MATEQLTLCLDCEGQWLPGHAELYLKLTYASGGFEWLASPLRVRYRAFFNAHCIFERF